MHDAAHAQHKCGVRHGAPHLPSFSCTAAFRACAIDAHASRCLAIPSVRRCRQTDRTSRWRQRRPCRQGPMRTRVPADKRRARSAALGAPHGKATKTASCPTRRAFVRPSSFAMSDCAAATLASWYCLVFASRRCRARNNRCPVRSTLWLRALWQCARLCAGRSPPGCGPGRASYFALCLRGRVLLGDACLEAILLRRLEPVCRGRSVHRNAVRSLTSDRRAPSALAEERPRAVQS